MTMSFSLLTIIYVVANQLYLLMGVNDVADFGIITATHSTAATPNALTVTLWFNFTIYQCTLNPTAINTAYSCDSTTFGVVGTSICNTQENKIMIDNSGTTNAVIIDRVWVTTHDGTLYGIDDICINNNAGFGDANSDRIIHDNECGSMYTKWKWMCIDNEAHECAPSKQIVFFDMTKPNIYITNSLWMDGTHAAINVINCPTPLPTACPVVSGEFCGYTLFVRGFNMFNTKISGNAVTDINYIQENTESWTDEGSTCSFSSLQFDSLFASYSQYASHDSKSIGLDFSTTKFGAAGSLSTERIKTKQYVSSKQSYIYTMNLKCISAKASVVAYNKIHWNKNFVNNLRTLPTTIDNNIIYSNDVDDVLESYIDFWNKFGTHLIVTAELGGSVRGTVTTDKCTVDQSYTDSTLYRICLNSAYNGVGAGGCYSETDSYSTKTNVQNSITNMQITVKGGDNSQFTHVFDQFGSKENDFQNWINDLEEYPDIVGGTLDEIHGVIKQAILLGNHTLNDVLSVPNYVDDATWMEIANAMDIAYDAYSQYLEQNDIIFGDIDCSLECEEGVVNVDSCLCSDCSDDCCPKITDANTECHVHFILLTVLAMLLC